MKKVAGRFKKIWYDTGISCRRLSLYIYFRWIKQGNACKDSYRALKNAIIKQYQKLLNLMINRTPKILKQLQRQLKRPGVQGSRSLLKNLLYLDTQCTKEFQRITYWNSCHSNRGIYYGTGGPKIGKFHVDRLIEPKIRGCPWRGLLCGGY